ncbi:MAG: aminomethyl-transferring glycine dehydrogenase subunit GcvPA [Betaproteobacteria bacterium]|nr:MAG: aminomethyl-transferring glycine dehydrogenase subunit GcvPA [Betaproteobacteria bacterium]
MPFIPHTDDDVRAMLAAIGVSDIAGLFEEIPPALRNDALTQVPPPATEMAVLRLMRERAERDGSYLNFIGAGAYEHHIPAAVWQIATRGEFYSAYTPYQAEASQGTLQTLYEYQTMMASLTGLAISNASLYDGASALAEAVLMAVRLHKGARRVLLPRALHPVWRRVVRTLVRNQGIELIGLPYDPHTGQTRADAFPADDCAALVVPQPNFFGVLEAVDELTDRAHQRGMLVIAAPNATALALLRPPGQWGRDGADIAAGEGQPLGMPLAGGGPYLGFMTCRAEHLRQMPGRIVGRTVDAVGKPGYTLTLQAREQHIRRSKATSNICTNQGLAATAATIYMALLGAAGLGQVARTSHARALQLRDALTAIAGVSAPFSGSIFHEFVLKVQTPVAPLLQALQAQGILGGYSLVNDYAELGQALLVCATETKTPADIERYTDNMARIIGRRFQPAPCALKPS